jgi:ribosomal protein S11
VAGYTYSFGAGYSDVLLIKTDANGNVQWAKTYGGTSYDFAYSVQQTSDGGYIVAGGTNSFGAGNDDFILIKTDANGNVQWAKTYGGTSYDWA